MNWVIGTDMYTMMCIKLRTNKNVLHKKNKLNKIQKFKKIIIINTNKWGLFEQLKASSMFNNKSI